MAWPLLPFCPVGAVGGEQARMEQESADSIVGVNAPVDLAGRTPLAWSVKAEKNKRNRKVKPKK